MDYNYFRITGGKVKEAYDDFSRDNAEGRRKGHALCEKYGASGWRPGCNGIIGFEFEKGKVPTGWRKHKMHRDLCVPGVKNAEHNMIQLAMEDAKVPNWKMFQCHKLYLGLDAWAFRTSGNGFTWLHVEAHGVNREILILAVPAAPIAHSEDTSNYVYIPPDEFCIPIKRSEYWQIVEESDRTKTLLIS